MPEWVQRDAAAPAQSDRLLQAALRDRFVVTMHDGDAFEGLLVEADDRVLILAQATSLSERGTRINVDGALYLERAKVAYLQRPGGIPAGGD